MEIARKPLFPFYVCEINFPTLNSAQAEAITWEIPALLNDTKSSTIRTDFITLSWFTLTHLPHCAEFSSKSIRTFYFNNNVHTVHISAKCISYSLEVYIYLYVFYLIWTLYPVYYSRAHARWSSWTRQVMLLFICAGVCVPACLHSHSAWRLEIIFFVIMSRFRADISLWKRVLQFPRNSATNITISCIRTGKVITTT